MKLSARIRQIFHQVEWNERIRRMWLPIMFALALGVVLCIQIPYEHNETASQEVVCEYDCTLDDNNTLITNTPAPEDTLTSEQRQAQEAKHQRTFHALCLFFGIGYLIVSIFQISLYAFVIGQKRKRRDWISLGCLVGFLILLGVDTAWMISDAEWSDTIWLGHFAVYSLLAIIFLVFPTFHHKGDSQTARYIAETIITTAILAAVIGLAIACIVALMEGFDTLFDQHISQYEKYIIDIILSMVFGSLLVMLLPNPEQEGFATPFTGKFCKILGQYILVPIVALYLLVLYAYIIKIGISWELPKGTITWMTSVMMGGLFGIIFLLYPTLYEQTESKRIVRILRYALPLVAIPPLIIMSIGLARRVSDYGWDINRLYVLALNCWFYLACIMLLIQQGKQSKLLTRLMGSFGVIFVLLSAIPYVNIRSYVERTMSRELNELVMNASIAFPDTALNQDALYEWGYQLDSIEATEIGSRMGYLLDNYGKKSISRYWNGEGWIDPECWGHRNFRYEYDGIVFKYDDRNYHYDSEHYHDFLAIPSGYSQMRTYCSREDSVVDLGEGRYQLILIEKEDTTRALLDTTTITSKVGPLLLHTDDDDMLMVFYLYIKQVENRDYLSLHFGQGFRFRK